jgi:hypothetical protein
MNRDQLREAVLGTGAWSKAGVALNESVVAPAEEVIEEAAAPVEEEAEETLEEGVEAGCACPLCHSTLTEDLSDERLAEHAENFMAALTEAGVLEEMEESEEEGEAIEEEESCDDEGEDKKPAFMKKSEKKSEKKDKK